MLVRSPGWAVGSAVDRDARGVPSLCPCGVWLGQPSQEQVAADTFGTYFDVPSSSPAVLTSGQGCCSPVLLSTAVNTGVGAGSEDVASSDDLPFCSDS